jgi:AAA domain
VRIAVSGTHCSGKTTLVEDFLALHADYVHEPEPYEWLVELGEEPSDQPSADDFFRQLEVSVERVSRYAKGARMIAERSPADFVAYMLALRDLGRTTAGSDLIDAALELAAAGMAHLDLVVVLPLHPGDRIIAPEAEDLELREAMNDRLLDLLSGESLGIVGADTRVIEVYGTRQQRLDALLGALPTLRSGKVVEDPH